MSSSADNVDRCAEIIWDYMLMHQKLGPMDAIFVLGSNDTRVAERAADLYFEGYAKLIICAGGKGKDSRFTKPEAEVFADILYSRKIPKEAVIIEPKSTNTGDNILFTKRLLKNLGLKINSFLLVQKPYMERRTYATFKKQWPEAECIVTSPIISYKDYFKNDLEYKHRYINVMVGDLIRIKEYPARGFQIEQEIPKKVWEAGQELIKMGFQKYIDTKL